MLGYSYSLLKEISVNYAGEELETLYIGGGTPSLLDTGVLKKIINRFKFIDAPEVTIEVNPEDVTTEKIKTYLELGINRISMGVQSLDDNILQITGRRHSAQRAKDAIQMIKDAGCSNLSVDLIYGLPTQSMQSFIADVRELLNFPISHISLYGLKIEDDSVFGKNPPSNLPCDDEQADMYQAVCEILPQAGFKQYEISNFAKDNYYSRHNVNYWDNNSYYGFGVSAHGYVDGFRYYNTNSIAKYMEKPDVAEYAHHVTVQEKLEEEIFLGMRKASGVNIKQVNEKFDIDFLSKYDSPIKKYKNEFLIVENGFLRFTTKGFMLSNVILSDFI